MYRRRNETFNRFCEWNITWENLDFRNIYLCFLLSWLLKQSHSVSANLWLSDYMREGGSRWECSCCVCSLHISDSLNVCLCVFMKRNPLKSYFRFGISILQWGCTQMLVFVRWFRIIEEYVAIVQFQGTLILCVSMGGNLLKAEGFMIYLRT